MTRIATRMTVAAMAALFALSLTACKSAEKLMEEGAKLETEGRYEEAVRKYISAYEKDPSVVNVEEQITRLGNEVIQDKLNLIDELEHSGRLVEAAEVYLDIDDLALRALEVGIALDRPADYGDRRYSAFRDAVASLMDQSLELFHRGDFGAADSKLREAIDRFDPTPDEFQSLLLARYDVLLAWTDAATSSGHYKEAVRRSDEAVAVAGEARIPADAALAIRARAIDLGTLYVAAVPVRPSDRRQETVSPWFLSEVNDRLELDYWSTPPEFVAVAQSALVRQRLRRMGVGNQPLSRGDARRLARDLDADLVVLAEVERFVWTEEDVHIRPIKARTRRGNEVEYSEVRGKLEYRALIRVSIIADNGDVIFEDHIEEHRNHDFKRAEYSGDVDQLDISKNDRKLFGRRQFEDLRADLEEQLAARVSERIAQRVFDRLQREVR